MKHAIAAALLCTAASGPAFAESCQDKFVRLMVNGNDSYPVKIRIVQEIKGGMKSVNDFLSLGVGHWMTVMVDPATMPWSLTYNNTMYQSSDKGQSWQKLRPMDSAAIEEKGRKDRAENAKTVHNAACGEAELGGKMHDTVEAGFETLQNFKTRNHYKYWVSRETGKVVKATYSMKGKGFESFSTQTIEPAPGLSLPTPQ